MKLSKPRNELLHTYTGRAVDPCNLKPSDISILDIAHGLSQLCRYAGQCKYFISVAHHSVEVSYILRAWGHDNAEQFAGLLHDASEAYLVDLPSMLKSSLPDYRRFERRAMKAVAVKFGLWREFQNYSAVKKADIQSRESERDGFRERLNRTPSGDCLEFLERFIELGGRP